MHKKPSLFIVLSALAVLAASFALVACGSSSSDSSTGSSALASYAPADTLFYADAVVRPTGDVATNVDDIATKLTGSTISEKLTQALDESGGVTGDGNVDYKTDIDPWLGENVALFGTADLSQTSDLLSSGMPGAAAANSALGGTNETYGVVAESTDNTSAQAFIDKAAKGQDTTSNEYEGNTYLIAQDDNTVLGMVGDNVVAASDEAEFKAIVDASNGDSLADSTGFKDVSGQTPSDSVLNIYTANEPILKASSEDQFPGIKDVYTALGVDIADSASQISLVPGDNQISVQAFTNTDSDIQSGDASELIGSFPADSIFAAGSAGVGDNITKIIDSLDKTGIEGIVAPGELKKNLDEASQSGVDFQSVISSIQDVGFFVSGTTTKNLGGALVITTDNPEPLKNVLGTFSSFIGLAGDAKVKPLTGGQTGFSVKTPQLPGRPVIVALKGDRIVVAIGTSQANQVLDGTGQALSGSTAFKDAESALGDDNLDLFANAGGIANLLREQPGADSKTAADTFDKFNFMASGHGSKNNAVDFILGLTN